MFERRFYRKTRRYPYYFHPECNSFEDLLVVAQKEGITSERVEMLDNAEYVIVLQNREEMSGWWRNCVFMVMNNTRWVLDHLEGLSEFQVNWNHYGRQRKSGKHETIGLPPKDLLLEQAFLPKKQGFINKV